LWEYERVSTRRAGGVTVALPLARTYDEAMLFMQLRPCG
jgi:hypothetical protein